MENSEDAAAENIFRRFYRSFGDNAVMNLFALISLVISILAYREAKIATDLQNRALVQASASYFVKSMDVFSCKSNIVNSKARFLLSNVGVKSASLSSISQTGDIPPNFYMPDLAQVELTNGEKSQLPIKLESGDSISISVPITQSVSEYTCAKVNSGTPPYNVSLDAILLSEKEYYHKLGQPYRDKGIDDPFQIEDAELRRQLTVTLKYQLQGERYEREVEVEWPEL